jgi:hypothetical protein
VGSAVPEGREVRVGNAVLEGSEVLEGNAVPEGNAVLSGVRGGQQVAVGCCLVSGTGRKEVPKGIEVQHLLIGVTG